MKKIYLLAALLLCSSISINAEKRTKKTMLSVASQVLAKPNGLKTSQLGSSEIQILDDSKSTLTIVGYENGPFVIIPNDDTLPEIIGRSHANSKYDAEKMPPAFKWYLEIANRNLQERLLNGTSAPRTTINPAFKESVEPLCTTKWGQDAPYNDNTPVYGDNTHYVTGCVATAMAQAMKYYNYPEIGTGEISYYFNSPDGSELLDFYFDEEPFEWDEMKDSYDDGRYTSSQAHAVAYLMSAVGASVQMQYTPTGSGAMTPDAAYAFYTYFGYDKSIDCYHRDLMHEDEWHNIVYGSLSDGCPLVFGAQTKVQGQDAGHSFIVDGYDSEGNVSVNFGWNGYADGYYELTDMNGYTYGFDVIPLRLPSADSSIKSFWSLWEKSIKYDPKSGSFNAQIINGSSRNFSGTISVILKNLTDGTEQILTSKSYENEPLSKGGYYNVKEYNMQAKLPENLADGQYRLYLASLGVWEFKDPSEPYMPGTLVEETSYQPVRAFDKLNNSYIITVSGGEAIAKYEQDSNWVLGVDNIVTDVTSTGLVKVYDIQGRMIYSDNAESFSIADVPAHGMLIVRNGSNVRKVIKK